MVVHLNFSVMTESINSRLERQGSFPSINMTEGHDFRKEFKGSILERNAKRCQKRGVFSSLLDKLLDLTGIARKQQKRVEEWNDELSHIESLPCEILVGIFSTLDRSSAAKCRSVCIRWKEVLEREESLRTLFPIRTLSRLSIRGLSKRTGTRKTVELRWVDYFSQSSNAIVLPTPLSPSTISLHFAFCQFNVQRLIIQDVSLTEELVDFIREHLLECPTLSPVQLSLHNVDFSSATALTFHRLLAVVGKSLEVLEMQSVYGLRPFDFTDAHLSQLDSSRIRRLIVDNIRLSSRSSHLSLGDASLKSLMAVGNFPTLLLDRCSVSTAVVCDYSQEWLGCAESEENAVHRTQVCTVKRCGGVKGTRVEEECAKRGLTCRRSSVSNTHTFYNIQSSHGKDEFTVALCPAPMSVHSMKTEQGETLITSPLIL